MSWHRSETMKCSHSRGVTPPTLMCRPRRILLPDQRHHDGMINIVVGCIAVCDILKREPADEADDTGIARLQDPIGLLVHDLKLADEGFDDDLCGVEHRGHREQIVRRQRALRRKDNSKFLDSCSPKAPRPAKAYSKHSRHRRLGSRNCVPYLDLVACRR